MGSEGCASWSAGSETNPWGMKAGAGSVDSKGSLQMPQISGTDGSVAQGVGRPVSAKLLGDDEGKTDCALVSDSDDGVALGNTKLR